MYIPCISHIYPIYIQYISNTYPIHIPYISRIYPIYIYIYPIYIPYINISHIYINIYIIHIPYIYIYIDIYIYIYIYPIYIPYIHIYIYIYISHRYPIYIYSIYIPYISHKSHVSSTPPGVDRCHLRPPTGHICILRSSLQRFPEGLLRLWETPQGAEGNAQAVPWGRHGLEILWWKKQTTCDQTNSKTYT